MKNWFHFPWLVGEVLLSFQFLRKIPQNDYRIGFGFSMNRLINPSIWIGNLINEILLKGICRKKGINRFHNLLPHNVHSETTQSKFYSGIEQASIKSGIDKPKTFLAIEVL